MKVENLSEIQRQHLAWRLDNKTGCGLMTACRIARLETEFNDKDVHSVFLWAGLPERSAKIHAGKVERFQLGK